jgi:hypothetical protein
MCNRKAANVALTTLCRQQKESGNDDMMEKAALSAFYYGHSYSCSHWRQNQKPATVKTTCFPKQKRVDKCLAPVASEIQKPVKNKGESF